MVGRKKQCIAIKIKKEPIQVQDHISLKGQTFLRCLKNFIEKIFIVNGLCIFSNSIFEAEYSLAEKPMFFDSNSACVFKWLAPWTLG